MIHNDYVVMNSTGSFKARSIARSELLVRVHASEAFPAMKLHLPLKRSLVALEVSDRAVGRLLHSLVQDPFVPFSLSLHLTSALLIL